jgi:hypothetical protein
MKRRGLLTYAQFARKLDITPLHPLPAGEPAAERHPRPVGTDPQRLKCSLGDGVSGRVIELALLAAIT